MCLEARRLAGSDDVRPYNLRRCASTFPIDSDHKRAPLPPPTRSDYPNTLHNPLRGVNMGQAPAMTTPSAAIAHIQLKPKLGIKPDAFFKSTHSRGLRPLPPTPRKRCNRQVPGEALESVLRSAVAAEAVRRPRESHFGAGTRSFGTPKSDLRVQ